MVRSKVSPARFVQMKDRAILCGRGWEISPVFKAPVLVSSLSKISRRELCMCVVGVSLAAIGRQPMFRCFAGRVRWWASPRKVNYSAPPTAADYDLAESVRRCSTTLCLCTMGSMQLGQVPSDWWGPWVCCPSGFANGDAKLA
jgi:hypothetical protein